MLRRIVFWTHLSVGLIAGAIVFILCATGAILAFELQIVARAEHDARARPAHDGAELLSPAELAARVALAADERIVSLEWSADEDMPVRAQTDKRNVTLLNGYSGEVLGHGASGLRSFMRWTTELHVSLTANAAGSWTVALANSGFVFLIASGLWLWWPRRWRWPAFRAAMIPRFVLKGKARDWNWHTTLGFWFLAPLLFIAASGLVLSFGAVDKWWRAFASAHLLSAAAPSIKPAISADPLAAPPTWSRWMTLIAQRNPGWRSLVLNGNGAPNKDGLLSCTVNFGTPRQRADVVSLKLDTRSGRISDERRWANDDASSRARAIARLGHSGEILGTLGQGIGFVACLAGCVIVYTGFALGWRRFVRTPTGSVDRSPADGRAGSGDSP